MEVSLQELAKYANPSIHTAGLPLIERTRKNLGLGKQFDAALAEKAPLSSACAVLKQ